MNDDLRRHLDGETSADTLSGHERREADEWDRMIASFRTATPRGPAPAWLEQRVMAEIEALPEESVLSRLASWLVRPAPLRVPPLAVGLALAGLAMVLVLPGRSPDGVRPVADGGPDGSAESVVFVQFVLEAPAATSVSVAGDFSEWEPAFALEDVDGDGVWTGRVPVRPGVHTYMFLIDGTQWQTDPRADRYQDDGFGNRNAVLAVAAGA